MTQDTRLAQKQIRLRIPQQYYREPIISHLISEYHLTVNITGAILGTNGNGDGWFSLHLQGLKAQIDQAIIYLSDLDIEIWGDIETDGW